MTALDIEGVLIAHRPYPRLGQVDCHGCDWSSSEGDETHRAHVAAVLREQIAVWLADFPWTETARDDLRAALVVPSRVPSEESWDDPTPFNEIGGWSRTPSTSEGE